MPEGQDWQEAVDEVAPLVHLLINCVPAAQLVVQATQASALSPVLKVPGVQAWQKDMLVDEP